MSVENDLPKGWVGTTLGDICDIKYGKDHKHLNEGSIPCYGSGGLMREVDSFLYDRQSVLIPRKGTLSNIFFVDVPFWTVDTLFYTIIDEKRVVPIFLFYKLKTYNLETLDVGSAVPSLTTAVLNQFPFEIPVSVNEQKAIASILTSFDDKIELLQAQNETLENIAQTIFKEWFGKYKVGDKLPEGWRVGKLGDVVKTINTGADAIKKAPIVDYNTGIKCLRIGDLSNNRPFDQWGYTKITDNFFKQFQLKKYDILVTRTSVLGLNKLILEDMNAVYNNGLIKLSLIEGVNPFYIYGYFRSKYYENYISMINNDTSTRPNMKIEYLLKFPILLSTEGIESKFSDIMGSLLWKVYYNTQQIQTLQATRDTLLPKLMSGQLRVNEFKEQLCEVM